MTITHRFTLAVVLVVASLTPSAAEGQPLCKDHETVSQCWQRLQLGEKAQEKKTEETQAARKSETGLANLAGLSSSVKDFLPILQLGGVLGAVDTDEKTGVVSVVLNTPFLGSASANGEVDKTLQLRATIESKAKLYEALEQKLPAEGRENLAKQLLAAKKDAQHVTVHATYNVSSSWLGRSFARHAAVLDALAWLALNPKGTTGAGTEDAERAFMVAAGELLMTVEANLSRTKWKDMSSADRAAVEKLLPGVVRKETLADAQLGSQWKAAGLDLYGQLVLNQPQLQFSGSRTFRDELFGPDLTTARVSFEMGLGNSLNAALGTFRDSCGDHATECLKQFTEFANQPGTRAAIKDGTRVAAFFEVVHNEAYSFSSAAPVLDLALAAGTGWTLGIDAGRLIGVDDEGRAAGRVDAALKWESPGNKTKDSRLVASLTVTRKVGEISVPFSLVYADYGLSANVGLKFDLFGAAK